MKSSILPPLIIMVFFSRYSSLMGYRCLHEYSSLAKEVGRIGSQPDKSFSSNPPDPLFEKGGRDCASLNAGTFWRDQVQRLFAADITNLKEVLS